MRVDTAPGSRSAAAILTSTNSAASASRSRFFHAKKCGAHSPRSRQYAATLCPLRACSKTTFRHFAHAFRLRCRCVILQDCYLARTSARWGSHIAHVKTLKLFDLRCAFYDHKSDTADPLSARM